MIYNVLSKGLLLSISLVILIGLSTATLAMDEAKRGERVQIRRAQPPRDVNSDITDYADGKRPVTNNNDEQTPWNTTGKKCKTGFNPPNYPVPSFYEVLEYNLTWHALKKSLSAKVQKQKQEDPEEAQLQWLAQAIPDGCCQKLPLEDESYKSLCGRANTGDKEAADELGRVFLNNGSCVFFHSYLEALTWFHKAGDYKRGNLMYDMSSKQLIQEIVSFLTDKALKGFKRAAYALGVIYRSGEYGVEKNHEEAIKYFEMARD